MTKLFSSKQLLLLLLLGMFCIHLYRINYNTAFLDEAIYLVLGKQIFAGYWERVSPFSWIGGMPFFYPVLSYIAGSIGGIVGTRTLSVFLGTLSLYGMFLSTRSLRMFPTDRLNTIFALISSLLLGLSTEHFYISRIAQYDMLAYTLFIFGCYFTIESIHADNPKHSWMASFFFFLSFWAKYTTAMFFPGIIAFYFLYSAYLNPAKRLHSMNLFLLLSSSMGFYLFYFFSDLHSFVSKEIYDRTTMTYQGIFNEFSSVTGLWYVFALPGCIRLYLMKKYEALLLIIYSLVPLGVHVYFHNTQTLHQNTLYSITFLVPLCAWTLTKIYNDDRILGGFGLAAASYMIFAQTLVNLPSHEFYWANTSHLVSFLQANMSENQKILTQEGDTVVLGIQDKIPWENIVGPYYISYGEKTGQEGYTQAIRDGYFNFIQLNDGAAELSFVDEDLLKNYSLVYSETPFKVYKKNE